MNRCNGCYLLDEEYYPVCYIFQIKEAIEVCPCVNCLVKPNCSSMCKERETVYLRVESKHINTIFKTRIRYEKLNRNKE